MASDAWHSHRWASPTGRRIRDQSGKAIFHHQCAQCRRDFAHDLESGERYAVHVSIFDLRRLTDPVTKQWLEEPCPGEPMPHDAVARSKVIDQ
jgi:hypothetical protein